MEIKNVIISIVLGLILFAVGGGLGVLYQMQQQPQAIVAPATTVAPTPQAIKDLSSKLVPSMVASGIITKIVGQSITLTKDGDVMTVAVRPDAKVYAIVIANPIVRNKPASTNKVINFTDLKTGDNISISIRLLPTGQIEGFGVLVLPPVPTASPTPTLAPR